MAFTGALSDIFKVIEKVYLGWQREQVDVCVCVWELHMSCNIMTMCA